MHSDAASTTAPNLNIQVSPPSWGLDRLDYQNNTNKTTTATTTATTTSNNGSSGTKTTISSLSTLDGQYQYRYTGAGVDVYIVDSGINSYHTDLMGRVTCGINMIETEDCEDLRGKFCLLFVGVLPSAVICLFVC